MPPTEGLPNVVFVGNRKRRIKHNLCLFLVIDHHEDGSPKTVRRILENEKVKVEQGMEFITAYVQHQVVER